MNPCFLGKNSCCIRIITSRLFTSSALRNPHEILGIRPGSSYAQVKQAFLKAAMQYHPDQAQEGKDKCSTSEFVRIRQAFEQIVSSSSRQQEQDGVSHDWVHDADLEPYFRQRTAEFLTFDMDESTRKEVVSTYEQILATGGNVKGGYWDMARQLAEREAARGTEQAEEPVLLDGSNTSVQRRPRKR